MYMYRYASVSNVIILYYILLYHTTLHFMLQIKASRDTSGKGSGMVASRKKKLARHGAEKDENGHKFKVQVCYYYACAR